MLQKVVMHAEVRVEIDWFVRGSVLANTIEAGASACRTHFKIESPDPRPEIERVIRLAKRGCFAEQMVRNAVPLASTYEVNGEVTEISLE